MELEDKNVDATVPKDSEGLTDVGLYAPDTLDLTQGNLNSQFVSYSVVPL